jgi:hypothetical protein
VDEKLGGLRKEPVHDQYSHAADAFRTPAVMIREPERKKEQDKSKPVGKLSMELVYIRGHGPGPSRLGKKV